MSNCLSQELSKGYIVSDPEPIAAPVPVLNDEYTVITVFNETDQNIAVSYKNGGGQDGDFIVPKNGRAFTRVINEGLMPATLKVKSIGAAATGSIIINLGN